MPHLLQGSCNEQALQQYLTTVAAREFMQESIRLPLRAFVRSLSPRLAECELTHLPRVPLDADRAVQQHKRYKQTLCELGAVLTELPALPEHPDGVFVEDTTVVLPKLALMTRPGVASREGEVDSIVAALTPYRTIRRIAPQARLDGGDVLRIDRVLYVGLSARTDTAGCAGLKTVVEPLGYEVRPVVVRGCLHLKTAATFIPPNHILLNPAWVEAGAFKNFKIIPVVNGENFAANTLTIGRTTLVSAAYPRTEEKLCRFGIRTQSIDISELHKAEAGLTCMSLILEEE